jgi:Zn-finger nucleic acid-binding protein
MLCPKCNSELVTKKVENVEVDQCAKCSGVWFDFDELRQVLDKDMQDGLLNRIENNEGDDSKKTPCPKCGGQGNMVDVVDPVHDIHIDTCPVCYGQWLDGGEYEKLKKKSIFDIFKF